MVRRRYYDYRHIKRRYDYYIKRYKVAPIYARLLSEGKVTMAQLKKERKLKVKL
jgi:hypothetical protein